jgi:hypothetical protein
MAMVHFSTSGRVVLCILFNPGGDFWFWCRKAVDLLLGKG